MLKYYPGWSSYFAPDVMRKIVNVKQKPRYVLTSFWQQQWRCSPLRLTTAIFVIYQIRKNDSEIPARVLYLQSHNVILFFFSCVLSCFSPFSWVFFKKFKKSLTTPLIHLCSVASTSFSDNRFNSKLPVLWTINFDSRLYIWLSFQTFVHCQSHKLKSRLEFESIPSQLVNYTLSSKCFSVRKAFKIFHFAYVLFSVIIVKLSTPLLKLLTVHLWNQTLSLWILLKTLPHYIFHYRAFCIHWNSSLGIFISLLRQPFILYSEKNVFTLIFYCYDLVVCVIFFSFVGIFLLFGALFFLSQPVRLRVRTRLCLCIASFVFFIMLTFRLTT